jgi:hypothetical protein
MGYMFEVILFHADGPSALDTFKAINSPLYLRLVDLRDGLFGILRLPTYHHDPDHWVLPLERVTGELSTRFGSAMLLFYNEKAGTSTGMLYEDGHPTREFGEEDERWVPYGEDGELQTDGPHLVPSQLLPVVEYDCIYSATEACLSAIHASPAWSALLLIRAFCHEEMGCMAEIGAPEPKQPRRRGKPPGG